MTSPTPSLFAAALNRKRAGMAALRSTVLPEANIQSGNAKMFQASSIPAINYPAAGAGLVELVRFQVPFGMAGALTGIQIVHNGAAGTYYNYSGSLTFHLLCNGYPVRGMESLYSQIGENQPQGMFFLLRQNDLLQVLVGVPVGSQSPAGSPGATLIGYTVYGGAGSSVPERGNQSRPQQGAAANTFAPGWRNGAPAGLNSAGGAYPFRNTF